MPSVFAFYRPRGIAGTYVVGIQLDLLPTEEALIIVTLVRNPIADRQEPLKQVTLQEGVRRQLYRIEQLIIGDMITIQIKDSQLFPYQRTMYTATEQGFTKTDIPFEVWNHATRSNHNYGVILLHTITLIDLDREDVVIQQEDRVVDALPVAQPQPADKRQQDDSKKTSTARPTHRRKRYRVGARANTAKSDPFAGW